MGGPTPYPLLSGPGPPVSRALGGRHGGGDQAAPTHISTLQLSRVMARAPRLLPTQPSLLQWPPRPSEANASWNNYNHAGKRAKHNDGPCAAPGKSAAAYPAALATQLRLMLQGAAVERGLGRMSRWADPRAGLAESVLNSSGPRSPTKEKA